ncbi:MAG: hypothetical protein NUW23_08355 [Firmicutes bacterium]|nr:hypothetical protein [Bacillota bacterium]
MSLREKATQDVVDAYSSGTERGWHQDRVGGAEFFSSRLEERDELEHRLSSLTEEQLEVVHNADAALIEHAREISQSPVYDEKRAGNFRGKNPPPKEYWWWWLDEIAEGVYPLNVLPEYLRDEAARFRTTRGTAKTQEGHELRP